VNGAAFIGFVDVQTRQWIVMDFSPKICIDSMTWFEEGELILREQQEFYKISLK
jgi:hypothetical protein